MGYAWVFIPPIVASLPFIYLRTQGIIGIGPTPVPYAAYAFIGTVIWQSFVDALNAPLKAVVQARPMLTKVNLPREAILLSALMQVGLSFLIRLVLLVAVLVWFKIAPAATAPFALAGIAALVGFGFMIGLLLTPLGILYTDVQQLLPVATTFLMLLTPVIYPVPKQGSGAALAAYNPLTPLVGATRDWLIVGPSPHGAALVVIGSATFVLLLAGWVAFRVSMPHLISRIGN